MAFLRFIKKNDDLFRTFLIENSDPHFRRKLFDLASAMTLSAFDVRMDEKTKDNVYRFLISGSLELLVEWIRSDYELPESDFSSLLYGLYEGSISGFAKSA